MKKSSQNGLTLMSLLVSLLIEILCVLIVLTAYRSMVHTTTESRIAANHDTQLEIGLTVAHMYLQNAGFGLDLGRVENFVKTTETIKNLPNVPVILWKYRSGQSIICQGLADISSDDQKNRLFVLLESIQTCGLNDSLSMLQWEPKKNLAILRANSDDGSNPRQIEFTISTSACSPYGLDTSNTQTYHPLVRLTSQTNSQKTANLSNFTTTVCLVNVVLP